MPKQLHTLTVEEVQYIAHRLAKEKLGFNEPIPDFSTRFPGKLESCLATPFQKFAKKSLYQGLTRKAAVMFYLMIKNHPFQNGNKRIAMTSMFVLLYKNKKWIKVDNQELYNFAVWVAQSNAKLKKQVIDAIEKFFETYIVDFK
ncbi:MAG: type II toxin-antitoxin system death-on-curing family toxin [Patescibacteria group bacterium]|jgi:death-on-curing family protein